MPVVCGQYFISLSIQYHHIFGLLTLHTLLAPIITVLTANIIMITEAVFRFSITSVTGLLVCRLLGIQSYYDN